MIFKDENNLSFYPKCLFMTAISLVTLLAGHLMFNDAHDLASWLKSHAINGDFLRQVILMFCLWLYVLRLGVTVFIFLKRKMEWSEMLIVTCLMSFALFSFAKVGGSSNKSVGTLHFSMLFIPFVMAMNFIFFIIPRLDNYLSAKYGKEFEEYAGRTKKFIPGIY
ncbi:MAG: hypothetical protein PF690_11495 [Deltaproteobacteria bacterium]|jgi:hypothetical protein|nr:hypothetical protein [Deltaproteobacteria bacterium]